MYSEKSKLHQREQAYRRGHLRAVAIDVTSSCNMSCAHCYAFPFVNQTEPINLDILRKACAELYDLGVVHYILQGGEPLTNWERLKAIVAMCHPDESYINVISNGWSINQQKIRVLKKLQVDKLTFSLDSGIAEEHDANRKEGSFNRIIKAITLVKEEGLLVGLSCVVTHISLYSDGFKRLLDLVRQIQVRLHLQIAEPVGKWENQQDILMTPEDSKYLKQLYLDSPDLPNGQKLLHRDLYTGEADRCPAASEFVSINADGEVFPCNFLQFSLGNIRNTSIRSMRNAILKNKWFQGCSDCICGENKQFIEEFLKPAINQPKPLDAYKTFCVDPPSSARPIQQQVFGNSVEKY